MSYNDLSKNKSKPTDSKAEKPADPTVIVAEDKSGKEAKKSK